MKKKANLRSVKGITLIALVITIIVLLILAGVSIAMLTGNNGILTQATRARDETRSASVQEQVDLWNANKSLDDSTGSSTTQSRDELLADLEEQGLLTAEEVATVKETGQVEIVKGKPIVFGTDAPTLAQMFKNAQTCDKTDGTCTDETHLHVGDYVDYNPGNNKPVTVGKSDTGYDTNQTYNVDKSTTWRVLGMDDSGHVLLTSGSPIKKSESDPYFIMQGAESYINCVSTLDKVCSIYNNSSLAEETRSITVDDINRVVGVKVDGTKVYKENDPNTNIDVLGFLGNSYTYESGDYAPENYMNDVYGTSVTRKKVGDKENYNSYGYMYDNLGVNQRIYNMLFAGTNSSSNYAKSYWLASPGSWDYGSYAGFGPGAVFRGNVYCGYNRLFNSVGYWNARRMAVRPVVVLKSDVAIDDVPKSANQTEKEDNWSQYNNNDTVVDSGYIRDATGVVDGSTGEAS